MPKGRNSLLKKGVMKTLTLIAPVVSVGFAFWRTNSLFDQRSSLTFEASKIRAEHERRISDAHLGYSKCMYVITEWNDRYKDSAGEEFARQLDVASRSAQFHDEIEQVNRCRSITKDFWRASIAYIERFPLDIEQVKAQREDHGRFVAQVGPLDQGLYKNERSERVFRFPPNLLRQEP